MSVCYLLGIVIHLQKVEIFLPGRGEFPITFVAHNMIRSLPDPSDGFLNIGVRDQSFRIPIVLINRAVIPLRYVSFTQQSSRS
jgi:hypothetical protein